MIYNLFISHSWTYSNGYEGLVDILDKSGLDYRNYSVPKDDPIHNAANEKQLEDAIDQQIAPCSCVLILAGVYATYSRWINKEIKIATKYNKPIIAIAPWGSERISQKVKESATEIVRWQTSSIKDAIQRNCI